MPTSESLHSCSGVMALKRHIRSCRRLFCRSVPKNPVQNHKLFGTCSQVFKHLMVDQVVEFTILLKTHLLANSGQVSEVDADEFVHHGTTTNSLQALYGDCVIPNNIVDFFNFGVYHVAPADLATALSQTCRILYKYLLKIEEILVVTRFGAVCQFVCLLRYVSSSLVHPIGCVCSALSHDRK